MSVSSTREVRDWALSRGINVPVGGQLSRALGEAYNRLHPDKPYPLRKQTSFVLTSEMAQRARDNRMKQRSMA